MPKKKKHHTGRKLVTAGLATLGMYLLYGAENAKKNRKIAKGWMLRAKGEVLDKAEKLKELDKNDYDKMISDVQKKYKKMKNVNAKELAELAKELKGHWDDIEQSFRDDSKKKK
jgi:hypothetical protein